jgi:PAS domain S-box-containing protein
LTNIDATDGQEAHNYILTQIPAALHLNKQLNALISSAMDAVVCIDAEQNITLFNASAELMFGFARHDVIGKALNLLIPQRFHARHGAYVSGFGQTGSSSRRMGQQRVLVGLRANGEEFPIEASISRALVSGEVAYSVILRDVTERVLASHALELAKAELQLLSRAAIQAREEERTRVSRELHDELGQKLTALKMDLRYLGANVDPLQSKHAEALQRMQKLLDETVANTRRIASNMRPLMLDDLGLCAALEWQMQQFLQRNPIQHSLDLGAGLDQLPPEIATHIFRIVQEALNNVAKHARASLVKISVQINDAFVDISLIDNGFGMHDARGKSGSKLGLLGIRERAYAAGGSLDIHAAEGGGVALHARLSLVKLEAST